MKWYNVSDFRFIKLLVSVNTCSLPLYGQAVWSGYLIGTLCRPSVYCGS